MDRTASFRNCDRCGYVGLDSAGGTIVERGVHVVTIECNKCKYRQVSSYPAKPEQERAIEAALVAARVAMALPDLGKCFVCRMPLTRPSEGRVGCLRCDDSCTDEELVQTRAKLERVMKLFDAIDTLDAQPREELYLDLQHSIEEIRTIPSEDRKTFEEFIIAVADSYKASDGGPPTDAATATGMYDD